MSEITDPPSTAPHIPHTSGRTDNSSPAGSVSHAKATIHESEKGLRAIFTRILQLIYMAFLRITNKQKYGEYKKKIEEEKNTKGSSLSHPSFSLPPTKTWEIVAKIASSKANDLKSSDIKRTIDQLTMDFLDLKKRLPEYGIQNLESIRDNPEAAFHDIQSIDLAPLCQQQDIPPALSSTLLKIQAHINILKRLERDIEQIANQQDMEDEYHQSQQDLKAQAKDLKTVNMPWDEKIYDILNLANRHSAEETSHNIEKIKLKLFYNMAQKYQRMLHLMDSKQLDWTPQTMGKIYKHHSIQEDSEGSKLNIELQKAVSKNDLHIATIELIRAKLDDKISPTHTTKYLREFATLFIVDKTSDFKEQYEKMRNHFEHTIHQMKQRFVDLSEEAIPLTSSDARRFLEEEQIANLHAFPWSEQEVKRALDSRT